MKKLMSILILLIFGILNAQEEPCVQHKRPKYSTGPHPTVSPIFPGCESFKESNIALDICFGNEIAQLIAHKMDMSIDSEIDSINSDIFKTKVIIDISQSGKLEMKLTERIYTEFENRLELKLDEISNETTGIIPAKYKRNYCASHRYQLPLKFYILN